MTNNVEIRKIIKADNQIISFVIKSVLTELNANIKGTAFYDKETNAMFDAYQAKNTVYYVALLNHEVIGGCGIQPLQGANNTICELQKMYILPKARGFKVGKLLLEKCLNFAKNHFNQCYLETFPQMKSAISLYQKNGFKIINRSLGNTSHSACSVFLLQDLNKSEITIKQFKTEFESKLATTYPKTEIESFFYLLTESYLNLKRIDISLNPDLVINPNLFKDAIAALKNQKPIQYIIGETEFYNLPFIVNKNVLIPRPETEELVDKIIVDHSNNDKINILDIGTGSGCIAISLAKNLPNATIYALDVSKNALEIAKKNAQKNSVSITFSNDNILNTSKLKSNIKFDVIVSNPPYVRNLEKVEISVNVLKNEPHLALFVTDDNPLLFYNKITDFAKTNLTKKGKLYFEINQYLGKETVTLIKNKGFKNIILKKDLFNNDRMVYCNLS